MRDAPIPLNTIPVASPGVAVAGSGLNQYIPDTLIARAAAVKLGKALFWDMQVGSDGKQACATCHFHAGTNNRIQNTMNRGPNNTFKFDDSLVPDIGPNQLLASALFPLHKFNTQDDRFSGVLRTTDDIVGAEGVYDLKFNGLNPGFALEFSVANLVFPDAQGFSVGGVNVRRVTARNTPTAINAVFNLRNFHDGRARHHFNGVNPFGNLDPVVTSNPGTPLLRTPIPFAKYTLGAGGIPVDGGVSVPASQTEFTMMEVNFSLFFGLAIQMYESTLVSDQTPFDAFLGATAPYIRANLITAGMQAKDAAIAPNSGALSTQEKAGMLVFFGKGLCFNCHAGPD